MKKPNFFIVGAPKCGTTSLATWLAGHPNIYFCPIKEPHHFNRDGLMRVKSRKGYERLFRDANRHHIAVGEGSPDYIYSGEAIPRILEYSPAAKFIVCLRNPIEMAPSLHAERLSGGLETIADFSRAWNLQAERRKGRSLPRIARREPARLQYGYQCRLGERLCGVYEHVARDRVLTILLDDLEVTPRDTYRGVLSFLGVADDGRASFPRINTAKKTRSLAVAALVRQLHETKNRVGINRSLRIAGMVNSVNVVSSPRRPLSEKMHRELEAYFADDVKRLQALIGRDLSGWLDEGAGKGRTS